MEFLHLDTCHPSRWPLGKIKEVHKGNDEKVRVVKVKMQDAYVSRPITKVCPLVGIKAVEDNEEESQPKRVRLGYPNWG